MSGKKYVVTITREGDNWLSDVPDVPGAHTWAPSLESLLRSTREAIILMDDLEDDAEVLMHCKYDQIDDELVREAATLGDRRRRHEEAGAELVDLTARIAERLIEHKVSVRDAAQLLDVSPGRISQIGRAANLGDRRFKK